MVKERSVVLRRYEYGDTSLVVVILTRGHGKVRFLARGARKPGSRMAGEFVTGHTGDIVYYEKEGRGLQLVREISGGPVVDTSAADLEKMCLLQAGLELADRSTAEGETGPGAFDLLTGFMEALERAGDPYPVFFALEAGLLIEAGLMPRLESCDSCGKVLAREQFSVNPSTGAVTCAECTPVEGGCLSPEGCEALRRLVREGTEGAGAIRLGPELRGEIGRLLHRLFSHHVEGYRIPGALRMLKGVERE